MPPLVLFGAILAYIALKSLSEQTRAVQFHLNVFSMIAGRCEPPEANESPATSMEDAFAERKGIVRRK